MGLSGFSGKVSNSFCIKEIFSGVRIVTRSKSPPCGALVWLRDQFWCQETVQKHQTHSCPKNLLALQANFSGVHHLI
jgi:hypothetical protein